MSDTADDAMIDRYLHHKAQLTDLAAFITEQAATLECNADLSAEDKAEIQNGSEMLTIGTERFFAVASLNIAVSPELRPILCDLTEALRAILGGAASTFRHLDASPIGRKTVLGDLTQAATSARVAGKEQEAEKVRQIIERAARNPEGKIRKPGAVKRLVAAKLGKNDIDYKTFWGYVAVIEENGRIVEPPRED